MTYSLSKPIGKQTLSEQESQRGFTLIELSIVLVIIGLIVGGVLSGQSLIEAAKTRATVRQVEQFNTAVNTFRLKYNFLPGDFTGTQINSINVTAGDGNGSVSDGTGAAPTTTWASITGEMLYFWIDLGAASLIEGAYAPLAGQTTLAASTAAPQSKLGHNSTFVAYTDGGTGTNYYMLSAFTVAGNALSLANGLSPIEAGNIDAKVDDGVPNTGTIQAASGTGVLGSITGSTGMEADGAAPTQTTCGGTVAPATVASYNINQNNTLLCSLRIQAAW